MAPATAAVSPIRSGGHVLDGILPHPGPARHLLRRHPRGRQRGPAAGGHPGRAARDRAGRRSGDRSGRAGWRAPARAQAVDPGPRDAGGWGLHRRRRPAALRADRQRAGPPGHGALHAGDLPALVHLRACPPARPAHRADSQAGVGGRRRTGDGPMTMDLDSTVCQVHGYHKQGAAYGYTHTLGYHPLVATRADSGEGWHARQRTGRANTARGAARFVDELAGRVRRAGASGELTMRMDSGLWSQGTIRACRRHQIRYSITVRLTKPIRAAIQAIDEAAWVEIVYPDAGMAQVAETR